MGTGTEDLYVSLAANPDFLQEWALPQKVPYEIRTITATDTAGYPYQGKISARKVFWKQKSETPEVFTDPDILAKFVKQAAERFVRQEESFTIERLREAMDLLQGLDRKVLPSAQPLLPAVELLDAPRKIRLLEGA